jgi:hypothetical protein
MPVALAYCTCMNNRMSNNETRSITQWEKANPNAQEAWQQAGWLGEEIIITLRSFPRKRQSREARPGSGSPAFAGRADAGCIALIADLRLRALPLRRRGKQRSICVSIIRASSRWMLHWHGRRTQPVDSVPVLFLCERVAFGCRSDGPDRLRPLRL